MASFKFPPELLAIITSLSDRETLRALRLTNHLLCAFATKNLFFKFSLNTYDRTCEHLELIIAHPRLKKHVRKIYLNTVEDDYESDDDRLEVDLELPWKWKDVLSMLSKLPNLESVILRFDKNCSIGDNYGETPQSNEYRETIIKWLGTGLGSLKKPLKELGFWNQQNVTPLTKDFQQVLSTLSSLRLNVVHEIEAPYSGYEIEKEEVQEFYARILPSVWLKPSMGSLRKLSLYSNFYWGFYPQFSLGGIHCPNLQSLTLGNYSFFEDKQLDWILSHSSTLQELYLDDCQILTQTRLSNLSKCPIPRSRMKLQTSEGMGEAWHHHYPRRWNEYFCSFEKHLLHLRRFAIGHSNEWDLQYVVMPFEKERDLVPVLMRDRYMAFDGDLAVAHFHSLCEYAGHVDWPHCDDEDREALKALYRKIKQQVDYGEFTMGEHKVADLMDVCSR